MPSFTVDLSNPVHWLNIIIIIATIIFLTVLYAKKQTGKDRLRLTLVVLTSFAAIGFLFVVKETWKLMGLDRRPTTFFQLGFLLFVVAEYILVYLTVIFGKAYKAGGFPARIYNRMLRLLGIGSSLGLFLGLLLMNTLKFQAIHDIIYCFGSTLGITLLFGVYKEI